MTTAIAIPTNGNNPSFASSVQDIPLDRIRESKTNLTRPTFCTTANERVYITASGREIEFGGTTGL